MVEELALGDFTGSLLDSLTNLRVYSGLASIFSLGKSAKYYLPRPYFMFTVAAALFRTPKALTTASGMRSWGWLISKLPRELSVHQHPFLLFVYPFDSILPLSLRTPVLSGGDLRPFQLDLVSSCFEGDRTVVPGFRQRHRSRCGIPKPIMHARQHLWNKDRLYPRRVAPKCRGQYHCDC